jgi:hypothetical protein
MMHPMSRGSKEIRRKARAEGAGKTGAARLSLAILFFLSQAVPARAAEGNLWERRRDARRAVPSAAGAPLLADLSAAPLSRLLVDKSPDLPKDPSRNDLSPALASLTAELSVHGVVRDVRPGRAGAPVFIHLQDVHGVRSAQLNVSALLLDVLRADPRAPVGLEGAAGNFDLTAFRGRDAAVNAEIGAFFFESGYIAGPELAAFSAPVEPRYGGVEDKALYLRNVEAVKASFAGRPAFQSWIVHRRAEVESMKAAAYSPALKLLDEKCRLREIGALPLGDYLAFLSAENPGTAGPDVALFLEARAAEASLDFHKAEAERNALLARLVEKLSPARVQALLRDSLSFRQGRVGYPAFYRALMSAAEGAGISWKEYPAFDAYVRYVFRTDEIRPEALFQQIAALEDGAWAARAVTPAQKEARRADADLTLLQKLAALTLTPAEWDRYKARRDAIVDPFPGVAPFEDFYRSAESRNDAMASRFREHAKGAPLAVLVAGGFHGDGLARLLARDGATLVTVSPKLEEASLGGASDYLSVFTRGKMPLDELFAAPRISLVSSPRLNPMDPSQAVPVQRLDGELQVLLPLADASPADGPVDAAALEGAIDRFPAARPAFTAARLRKQGARFTADFPGHTIELSPANASPAQGASVRVSAVGKRRITVSGPAASSLSTIASEVRLAAWPRFLRPLGRILWVPAWELPRLHLLARLLLRTWRPEAKPLAHRAAVARYEKAREAFVDDHGPGQTPRQRAVRSKGVDRIAVRVAAALQGRRDGDMAVVINYLSHAWHNFLNPRTPLSLVDPDDPDSIDHLKISPALRGVLKWAGVTRLSRLALLTAAEVNDINGFTPEVTQRVLEAARKIGLALPSEMQTLPSLGLGPDSVRAIATKTQVWRLEDDGIFTFDQLKAKSWPDLSEIGLSDDDIRGLTAALRNAGKPADILEDSLEYLGALTRRDMAVLRARGIMTISAVAALGPRALPNLPGASRSTLFFIFRDVWNENGVMSAAPGATGGKALSHLASEARLVTRWIWGTRWFGRIFLAPLWELREIHTLGELLAEVYMARATLKPIAAEKYRQAKIAFVRKHGDNQTNDQFVLRDRAVDRIAGKIALREVQRSQRRFRPMSKSWDPSPAEARFHRVTKWVNYLTHVWHNFTNPFAALSYKIPDDGKASSAAARKNGKGMSNVQRMMVRRVVESRINADGTAAEGRLLNADGIAALDAAGVLRAAGVPVYVLKGFLEEVRDLCATGQESPIPFPVGLMIYFDRTGGRFVIDEDVLPVVLAAPDALRASWVKDGLEHLKNGRKPKLAGRSRFWEEPQAPAPTESPTVVPVPVRAFPAAPAKKRIAPTPVDPTGAEEEEEAEESPAATPRDHRPALNALMSRVEAGVAPFLEKVRSLMGTGLRGQNELFNLGNDVIRSFKKARRLVDRLQKNPFDPALGRETQVALEETLTLLEEPLPTLPAASAPGAPEDASRETAALRSVLMRNPLPKEEFASLSYRRVFAMQVVPVVAAAPASAREDIRKLLLADRRWMYLADGIALLLADYQALADKGKADRGAEVTAFVHGVESVLDLLPAHREPLAAALANLEALYPQPHRSMKPNAAFPAQIAAGRSYMSSRLDVYKPGDEVKVSRDESGREFLEALKADKSFKQLDENTWVKVAGGQEDPSGARHGGNLVGVLAALFDLPSSAAPGRALATARYVLEQGTGPWRRLPSPVRRGLANLLDGHLTLDPSSGPAIERALIAFFTILGHWTARLPTEAEKIRITDAVLQLKSLFESRDDAVGAFIHDLEDVETLLGGVVLEVEGEPSFKVLIEVTDKPFWFEEGYVDATWLTLDNPFRRKSALEAPYVVTLQSRLFRTAQRRTLQNVLREELYEIARHAADGTLPHAAEAELHRFPVTYGGLDPSVEDALWQGTEEAFNALPESRTAAKIVLSPRTTPFLFINIAHAIMNAEKNHRTAVAFDLRRLSVIQYFEVLKFIGGLSEGSGRIRRFFIIKEGEDSPSGRVNLSWTTAVASLLLTLSQTGGDAFRWLSPTWALGVAAGVLAIPVLSAVVKAARSWAAPPASWVDDPRDGARLGDVLAAAEESGAGDAAQRASLARLRALIGPLQTGLTAGLDAAPPLLAAAVGAPAYAAADVPGAADNYVPFLYVASGMTDVEIDATRDHAARLSGAPRAAVVLRVAPEEDADAVRRELSRRGLDLASLRIPVVIVQAERMTVDQMTGEARRALRLEGPFDFGLYAATVEGLDPADLLRFNLIVLLRGLKAVSVLKLLSDEEAAHAAALRHA